MGSSRSSRGAQLRQFGKPLTFTRKQRRKRSQFRGGFVEQHQQLLEFFISLRLEVVLR